MNQQQTMLRLPISPEALNTPPLSLVTTQHKDARFRYLKHEFVVCSPESIFTDTRPGISCLLLGNIGIAQYLRLGRFKPALKSVAGSQVNLFSCELTGYS